MGLEPHSGSPREGNESSLEDKPKAAVDTLGVRAQRATLLLGKAQVAHRADTRESSLGGCKCQSHGMELTAHGTPPRGWARSRRVHPARAGSCFPPHSYFLVPNSSFLNWECLSCTSVCCKCTTCLLNLQKLAARFALSLRKNFGLEPLSHSKTFQTLRGILEID